MGNQAGDSASSLILATLRSTGVWRCVLRSELGRLVLGDVLRSRGREEVRGELGGLGHVSLDLHLSLDSVAEEDNVRDLMNQSGDAWKLY